MVNQEFQYLIQKFGVPDKGAPLRPSAFERYRGKLPGSLLAFWKDHGLGLWRSGRFQFCDPETYASTIEKIFSNDPALDPARSHVYGYSAFGILFVWNELYHNVYIDLVYGNVRASLLTSEKEKAVQAKLGPDRVVGIDLASLDQKTYDGVDIDGKPLFERVMKSSGPLGLGDCYGFTPALAMGGEARVENAYRTKALEHFSILADLVRFELVDYSTGRRASIRQMGR